MAYDRPYDSDPASRRSAPPTAPAPLPVGGAVGDFSGTASVVDPNEGAEGEKVLQHRTDPYLTQLRGAMGTLGVPDDQWGNVESEYEQALAKWNLLAGMGMDPTGGQFMTPGIDPAAYFNDDGTLKEQIPEDVLRKELATRTIQGLASAPSFDEQSSMTMDPKVAAEFLAGFGSNPQALAESVRATAAQAPPSVSPLANDWANRYIAGQNQMRDAYLAQAMLQPQLDAFRQQQSMIDQISQQNLASALAALANPQTTAMMPSGF